MNNGMEQNLHANTDDLPEKKSKPHPTVGDLNNPQDLKRAYTHVRASMGDKRVWSERAQAERTMRSPDVLDEVYHVAPPNGAYPLSPDHPVFLRAAELGVHVFSPRMYKVVVATWGEGFYSADVIECMTVLFSGKVVEIPWGSLVVEERIPDWAWSRFFLPSGRRRRFAVPGLPLPGVGVEDSVDGVEGVSSVGSVFGMAGGGLVEEELGWDASSFSRLLFVPGLQGQFGVFERRVLPLVREVEGSVFLGGMLRLAPFLEVGGSVGDDFRYVSPVVENALLFNGLWAGSRYSSFPFVCLMGSTEMLYLNMGKDLADKYLRDTSSGVNFVREGWLSDEKRSDSAFRFYVAVEVDGRLVTHAGFSYGEWVNLGRPQSAREAAYALNAKYFGTLYQGQCLRLGDGVRFDADPIMAHSVAEVYSSWAAASEVCPFPQVHGSSSMRDALAYEAMSTFMHPMFYEGGVSLEPWGTLTNIRGALFFAVDGLKKTLLRREDYQRGFGSYVQKVHKRHATGVYAPNVPTLVSADGLTIL